MPETHELPNMDRLPKMVRVFSDCDIRAVPAKGGKDDGFKRFELTVSSEFPVRRWFGNEILLHTKEAVDLSRFNDGAPVLNQHDSGQQIGVIEPGSVRLRDKKLSLVMRFSRANPDAVVIAGDIEDGIRRNVSIGYIPQRAKLVSSDDETGDTWEIGRWQPLEVSVVSVPADPTVGFDRSAPTFPVELDTSLLRATPTPSNSRAPRGPRIETPSLETRHMPEEIIPTGSSRGDRRALADANTRAADIAHLCAQHGLSDRAAEYIESGKPATDVAREILIELSGRQAQPGSAVNRSALVFNTRELRRYSYARAIYGAAMAREGAGRLDGLELEVHQEISRSLPKAYTPRGGVLVPMDTRSPDEIAQAMERRSYSTRATMTSFGAGAASELVHDAPGQLIELLRAKARVIGLGATTLPGLTNPIPFPKQLTGSSVKWGTENPGSDTPASNPTFGTVTITPKTLMGAVPFSRQLLVLASANVEALVRNDLAQAHGLAVDRAAIHGTGVGDEPLGIYNIPGVNTEAFGGAISYAHVINAVAKIADDNADTDRLGLLTTPLAAAQAMKTQLFPVTGSDALWSGPIGTGLVAGIPAASSSQVSKTMSTLAATGGSEHGLIVGNWSDLLIGFWGALELISDPYTLAGQGLIKVTSFQMADIAARHGESFCVSTGQTIS